MSELDGRRIAKDIRAKVAADAAEYRSRGIVPTLAIVLATEDESARWYVRSLMKAAENCGVASQTVELPAGATTAEIAAALRKLAADPSVHGVILQTPLPDGVVSEELIELVPPAKDVDGINPLTAGRLQAGEPAFAPATAEAVMVLLDAHDVPVAGRHAVIVGRSRVVGKPVSGLLLARDATVTTCHSRSGDLSMYTRQADILVVAAGKPGLVTPEMVSEQAVVIDVGTNVVDGELVGDVAEAVAAHAAGLTPVPGGVGPVTTALILQHVLTSVSTSLRAQQTLQ